MKSEIQLPRRVILDEDVLRDNRLVDKEALGLVLDGAKRHLAYITSTAYASSAVKEREALRKAISRLEKDG